MLVVANSNSQTEHVLNSPCTKTFQHSNCIFNVKNCLIFLEIFSGNSLLASLQVNGRGSFSAHITLQVQGSWEM